MFGRHDFQRGPDVAFEVPGFGAAVAGAEDDMDMQGGLALRIVGDRRQSGKATSTCSRIEIFR